MRTPDTPGWYVEDDVAASVKKARKSDTPISSIIWGLEAAFSDDTPKERIKRIVESIPDENTQNGNTDLPLSQPPATDAEPREQPARIISIQDISYLSPREAARVIGLTLEQFDGNTVRPRANDSAACNLYWRRQKSTVGIRIIPSVGQTVTEDDILPLKEGKTSIDSVQSPSQLAAVTNGKFSEKAKNTVEESNIQWYDGGHVEAWFRRAKIPPGALGAVLENGENHQGPLDELVDISGIANDISLDPFESSRVIDEADLSRGSDLGSPEKGSSNHRSSSGGESRQTGGSEHIAQPDSPSKGGETGTLYADPSEDGDYGALDRFVDGIGSDSSSSVSSQEQNGTPQDSSNQEKTTPGDDSAEDESEYECAICGATYAQYQNYSAHISRCTGDSPDSKANSQNNARDHKQDSEYECDNCGATYSDHQEFSAHVGSCKGGGSDSETDFEWNSSEDISRKELLFELIKVKSKAGESVTRRDLNNYGDYGAPQYEKEFGSIEEALDVANMDFAGDQS